MMEGYQSCSFSIMLACWQLAQPLSLFPQVSLQYREKRMEEEREYLNVQVRSLNKELAEKSEEVMAARRDAITKSSGLRELEMCPS